MSLEQAVAELVGAINRNTDELVKTREAYQAHAASVGTRKTDLVQAADVIEKAKETGKVTTAKKPASPPSSASSAPGAPPSTTSDTPTATPEATAQEPTAEDSTWVGKESENATPAPAFDYKVLQEAVLALVKKDHAAAVAILTEFKVRKATELDPAQWKPCYDKFAAALGLDTDALA